ncbi:hypothetical protein N7540_011382 [Penicillium herquei]|nr:hypothetical protein N7540_011382 [Penicillium herquei]
MNSFKVQVLVLPDIPANALYLYNANIPSEFLDKFDEPCKFSPSCPIEIKYCRIDMGIGSRLRKLHSLLCPGSCTCCTPCDKERDL